MPQLTIRLLGPPQIAVDGRTVTLPRQKALALCAVLAVKGEPQPRDLLATMLWPAQDQQHARASLRRVLAVLTERLGHEFFVAQRESIGLDLTADCWIDVAHFCTLLAPVEMAPSVPLPDALYLAPLTNAVELYRSDFLTGFSLRDAPEFDSWQFQTAEQLRHLIDRALETLLLCHEARGATAQAVLCAQRLLELDPLDERAHAHLIRLYARTGKRSRALHQYEHCVKLLRAELDTPPTRETQQLLADIKSGTLVPLALRPEVPLADVTPTAVVDEIRSVTAMSMGTVAPLDEAPRDLTAQAQHMADFLERARASATAIGACVDHLSGDGGLLHFGLFMHHEDDAERALRLAFVLLRIAQRADLHIAIGIKTGPVYLSTHPDQASAAGSRNSQLASPVAAQAARLQRAGEVGQIVIDRNTYRRIRDAYATTVSTVDWDGMPIYRVLYPLAQGRKSRGMRNLQAAMIGRDAELDVLLDRYACAQIGQGQIVLVEGEAGVGKSRLAAEFKAALARRTGDSDAPLWLEGRCLEMSMVAGYWPFRELLRSFFGWRFDEPGTAFALRVVRRLQAMVDDGHLSSAARDEILPVVAVLLSLHFTNGWAVALTNNDAAQMRRRTLRALTTLLKALARGRPVIVVLEDLHWADDLTIDLIIYLLDHLRDQSILLLCLYRPVAEHRVGQLADLAARRCPGDSRTLVLHDLLPDQARQLVATLLASDASMPPSMSPSMPVSLASDPWTPDAQTPDAQTLNAQTPDAQTPNALTPATQAWILERGQGNPFFMEELVRMLIDTGRIVRRDGRWISAAADGEIPTADAPPESVSPSLVSASDMVPHNVDSLIRARVDQLSVAWRQVLQLAAVIGRTVQLPVLQRLVPPAWQLDDALWNLETRGFLRRAATASTPAYSFQHALTREAVYCMLPADRRLDLHVRTARAIEAVFADALDDQVERLAYHYAQTDEHEKAGEYLLRAGEKAQRAYLNREAANSYEAARHRFEVLNRAQPSRTRQATIARIWYHLGRVYYALGNLVAAEHAMESATATGAQAGLPPETLARFAFWHCEAIYWQEGSSPRLATVARAGLALLEDGACSVEAVILQGHLALYHYALNDSVGFYRIVTWIGDVIPDLPYCEELSAPYSHVIDAALTMKASPRAHEVAVVHEQKANDAGDLVSAAKARHLQGRGRALTGDYAAGITIQIEAVEMAAAAGESTILVFILNQLAYDCLLLARYECALTYAMQIRDCGEWRQSDSRLIWWHETMGRVLLGAGQPADAIPHLQARLQSPPSTAGGTYPYEAALCLAQSLLALDDRAAAAIQFRQAAEQTPPDLLTRPYHLEQKPLFAANVAGLDQTLDDAGDLRRACADLRAIHAGRVGLFQQWFLAPVQGDIMTLADHDVDLRACLAPPWRWCDPQGDSHHEFGDQALVIDAADGRDLWFVNQTAPRFVRPMTGDCVIQITCGPGHGQRPAMGGLLLWHDLRNFVRLDRGARGPAEISFMGCLGGEDALFGRGRLPASAVTLRLDCRARRVRAFCCADDQEWFTVGEVGLTADAPWWVGFFAAGYVDRTLYPGPGVAGGALHVQALKFWSRPEE